MRIDPEHERDVHLSAFSTLQEFWRMLLWRCWRSKNQKTKTKKEEIHKVQLLEGSPFVHLVLVAWVFFVVMHQCSIPKGGVDPNDMC